MRGCLSVLAATFCISIVLIFGVAMLSAVFGILIPLVPVFVGIFFIILGVKLFQWFWL